MPFHTSHSPAVPPVLPPYPQSSNPPSHLSASAQPLSRQIPKDPSNADLMSPGYRRESKPNDGSAKFVKRLSERWRRWSTTWLLTPAASYSRSPTCVDRFPVCLSKTCGEWVPVWRSPKYGNWVQVCCNPTYVDEVPVLQTQRANWVLVRLSQTCGDWVPVLPSPTCGDWVPVCRGPGCVHWVQDCWSPPCVNWIAVRRAQREGSEFHYVATQSLGTQPAPQIHFMMF